MKLPKGLSCNSGSQAALRGLSGVNIDCGNLRGAPLLGVAPSHYRLHYRQANELGASKVKLIGCKSIHPKGSLSCTQFLNGSPVGFISNLLSL